MEKKLKEYTGNNWNEILAKYLLLIYAVACIMGGIIVLFSAMDTFENSLFLGIAYLLNALITIAFGVYSFIIRNKLLNYRNNADQQFLIFLEINAIFQIAYQLILLCLSFRFKGLYYIFMNLVLFFIIFIPHKTYYDSRHYMFSDDLLQPDTDDDIKTPRWKKDPDTGIYILNSDGVSPFRMQTLPPDKR